MKHLYAKSLMLACALTVLSALGLLAMAPRSKAPALAPPAEDNLVFHGSIEQSFSTDWNQIQKYGVYSFTLGNDNAPTPEGPLATVRTVGGGFYFDGVYYAVTGQNEHTVSSMNWTKYDAYTWEMLDSRYHGMPTLTDSYAVAYDYISGRAYAAGRNRGNQTNPYELRTIDMQTGDMTNVGPLSQCFPAMAFDSQGNLWGISRQSGFPYTASLYKIDTATGACTKIGDLGFNQRSEYSAACFDHRNGKLYWTARTMTYNEHYEETYRALVAEVDLSTGRATAVRELTDSDVFSSLYIRDAHPKAPEAASSLAFAYNSGSTDKGKPTFNTPLNAYDRSPLSGFLRAEIYIDGNLQQTLTGLTPGSAVTGNEITLTPGRHTLRVYLYSQDGKKSLRTDLTCFGGADVPAQVQNLQAVYTPHHETATLTWTAPTQGKNGGSLDPSKLTYKVIRRPDMAVVAEGLKACTFTDTPQREQYLSQYEVIPMTDAGAGPSAYTSPEIVGQARPLTYLETFDSATAFNTYTIIDVAGVSHEDGDRWLWHPDFRNACYWLDYSYRNAANAWIVTPTLQLKEGYVYRVTCNGTGYSSGAGAKTTFSIHAGEFPTEASLKDHQLLTRTYNTQKGITESFTALFTARKGEAHIGFHLINDACDHFGLDNVRVQEYGPAGIPAAPELVSTGKDDNSITVTVKLPLKNVADGPVDPISEVRMYTADRRRYVANVKTNGEAEVTLTDSKPNYGLNDYVVVAVNAHGAGMELPVTVNMKPDAPKPVENLVIVTQGDGRDALLTWNYPSDMKGVDGNALTPDQISYDIYRTVNWDVQKIASVTGETEIYLPDLVAAYGDVRQMYMTLSVVARTLGGEASGVEKKVLLGRAYELPVNEVFAGDYTSLSPWEASSALYSSFYSATSGYDPRCTPQEGKLLTFSGSKDSQYMGVYISPRINLTGLLNPKATFTIYRHPDANLASATVQVGIIEEKNGREQDVIWFPEIFQVQNDTEGWADFEVSLASFASCPRASVVIRCMNNKRKGAIHFDAMRITGDKPQYDARVSSLTGPETAIMGRENTYYAVVENNGLKDLDNVKVTFLADDKEIETKTLSLSEGEVFTQPLVYTPALHEAAATVRLSVKVSTEGDSNPYNNSTDKRVRTEAPNLPYVTDLAAVGTDEGHVHLTWSDAIYYPHEAPLTDNVESYPDFTIENFGDWVMHDLDGGNTTFGISSSVGVFDWENAGKPQAYIVFNPQRVGVTQLCTAHSGSKCLVSFSSAAGNNDWLISPPLSGHEQTISFFVRELCPGFYEDFDVMISRSGTEPEDFQPLTNGLTIESASWQRMAFTLPAGTRHFAIVCKTPADGFGLMLDDFEYVPAQPEVELTGYNVYRDFTLLADGLGETEHLDTTVDPDREYTYHVSATYTDGESIFSEPLLVRAAGVNTSLAPGQERIWAFQGVINTLCPAGAPVSVHTLSGQCLYNFASTGAESLTVAPGIYIVRAGSKTAKVIVK